ncbi:MMPL family transporter [Candidatus Woesearchaeota archaeon]|nr:MMPL family transporter [Candidatus Woesearchaeota archaeon]
MKFFDKLSEIQYKHAGIVMILSLLITLLLFFGVNKVSMQSDLNKMSPQDLPIYKIQNQIKDNFGGNDATLILIKVENKNKDDVYDIRDPKVIGFVTDLQNKLEKEEIISTVSSIGMFFNSTTVPKTLEQSKLILSNIPYSNNFFNKDYSSTLVMVSSDLGGGEKKVNEIDSKIKEILSNLKNPEGIKVYVTGTPQIRIMILNLLVKDALFTLSLAALIILILLIILQKSFTKAILVFSPLLFGLIWTLGITGFLNIKLSVATVGVGAMILGLGVEYGIFIVSRYKEERVKNSSSESIRITVNEIGSSILGSGTTTIVGFLALSLTPMPMLKDLGLSLALGISCSILSAIIVNPSLIILEERFEHWSTERLHSNLTKKKELHKKRRELDKNDKKDNR